MLFARIPVLAAILLLPAFRPAQVDTSIWVATQNNIHEVSRDGTLAQTYPAPCISSFFPCRFSVARDRLGHVFIGREAPDFSSISGSVQVYRSGVGLVSQTSLPASDVMVDGQERVWFVRPATGLTMVVDNITVYRTMPGLGFFTGSTFVQHNTGELAPHSDGGVWLAAGSTLRRISSNMVQGPVLGFPGPIEKITSDLSDRLWVWHGGLTLDRVVDLGGGTLVVDLSIPFSGIESMHIDLCGVLHVHVQGGISTIHRIADDGSLMQPVSFGLRFRTAGLGTAGGYWFQHGATASGVQVFSITSEGTTVQYLEPASSQPLGGIFLQGDFTGARLAAQHRGLHDSDGDQVLDGDEARRGSDYFLAQSRPPVVGVTLVQSSPPTWQLAYADPDPRHANFGYQLALSFSSFTGFPVGLGGTCPLVPLVPDELFLASVSPTPLLSGFGGSLDAAGSALAGIALPLATPSGVGFHVAGVTFAPGIGTIVSTSTSAALVTP